MKSAVRFLLHRPVFALAAVLTVALGIGANTALFGIIYAVLLRPLPFRDPGRLVQIWETHPALPQLQVTAPDFEDWKNQAQSFAGLAAYTLSALNTTTLFGQGEPAIIHATMASSNLFPMMGIQISAGRAFTYAEQSSRQHVALLSENLWRRKFRGDPTVIGRQIRLAAGSFQVIGVVPQGQVFPEWADLWIPLSLMDPDLQHRRKSHPLEVVGRLKPTVSAEQAQGEMQTIARRLAQDHPDTNATVGAYVIPLAMELTQAVRPSLLLAWAAVGLVLLIACANLAQLFSARVVERTQEMAIREALGAKSWHLIRQLLGESLIVAAIGGVAGVGLASAASQLARKMLMNLPPTAGGKMFDAPVLLFGIGISLAAGLLFGLPTCWQVLRSRGRLLESGRSIISTKSRFTSVLIAGEVAMALLVLSGAILLTRSFAALLDEDPGFQPQHVWAIANLPLRNDFNQSAGFFTTRLGPAVKSIPGVVDVAAVNLAPLSSTEHSRFATRFGVEGRAYASGGYPVAQNRWMTAEYFRVLGVPLKRGRWLSDDDGSQPLILVNETLARRFFPNQEAVGKRLVLGVMDPKQQLYEIVGVVGDVRDLGLDREAEPTLYGIATGPVMTILVKAASSSNEIAVSLRNAIHSADPEIPITQVQPLQQNLSDSLARRRSAVFLLAIFGGMAAFLTACGIYGLLTHSVNVRVREFGVRSAVGAAPRELVSMILREAIILTLPGLILGALLSLSFVRIMKGFVYQVAPADPVSIATAAVFLVLLTFFSAWLPARRAAALDPALALRAE